MASDFGSVTIALELTTQGNIAFLKQLTDTLVVVRQLAEHERDPQSFNETALMILDTIQLICTFPANTEQRKDEHSE